MAMGAVNSIHSLLFLRFLLGVAEAGFFPCFIYYLTLWFTHEERAVQIAISFIPTFAGFFLTWELIFFFSSICRVISRAIIIWDIENGWNCGTRSKYML